MHGIALTTRPTRPGPNHRLGTFDLPADLIGSFLVQQGIQVVQCSVRHAMVIGMLLYHLAEIRLDHRCTQLQQVLQQPLIPANSFWIRKINVPVELHLAEIRPQCNMFAFRSYKPMCLCKSVMLGVLCYAGKLPKAYSYPLLFHLFQIRLRVRKSSFTELPLAFPVLLKPAGIDVDDITRIAALAHVLHYHACLISGEVTHAAHPCPIGPERHIRGKAGDSSIIAYYLLYRISTDEEQIQYFILHHSLGGTGGYVSQGEAYMTRRHDQQSISLAGKVERHILVGSPAVYPKSIGILQHKCFSSQIHRRKTFSGTGKFLVRLCMKRVYPSVD